MQPTRRDFTKVLAGAAAFAAMNVPSVHAAGSDLIQVALVGCGGRGTGAAQQALSTRSGPIKLIAMADVFQNRLDNSAKALQNHKQQFDVPADRRFIGFDAYRKAMDCLKPGDVVILTTPPAFRWVHYTYAIEKSLNVFMEKPVTVDGPSSRRMLALNDKALAKNLKVGVGLMCRHCHARAELIKRIRDGAIGDIIAMRAYRMGGGAATAGPKPDNLSEVLYQIRSFHAFLWASGGVYSDFLIHNIDECCWVKDAFPIKAHALGGRHYRGRSLDQNFDTYSVQYTFPDGTKLFLDGRQEDGCYGEFASYVHGSKNSAVISTWMHTPAKCRIYKGQNIDVESELSWAFPQPEPNPYQTEWDDLVQAIRDDKPYNEVQRGVEASLVTSMGRMAAHTGQVITREQILNCQHEFAPLVDQLTMDGPAPLQLGPDGKYPQPQPGKLKDREY